MIKNAREAREVLRDINPLNGLSNYQAELYHKAQGYLDCLEHGEEVRVLVETLNVIFVKGGGYLSWNEVKDLCNRSISLYKDSLKPEGK